MSHFRGHCGLFLYRRIFQHLNQLGKVFAIPDWSTYVSFSVEFTVFSLQKLLLGHLVNLWSGLCWVTRNTFYYIYACLIKLPLYLRLASWEWYSFFHFLIVFLMKLCALSTFLELFGSISQIEDLDRNFHLIQSITRGREKQALYLILQGFKMFKMLLTGLWSNGLCIWGDQQALFTQKRLDVSGLLPWDFHWSTQRVKINETNGYLRGYCKRF